MLRAKPPYSKRFVPIQLPSYSPQIGYKKSYSPPGLYTKHNSTVTDDLHFALDIHEYEPSGESDSHNYEFRPKWPFQGSTLDFLRSPVDENVEGPDDTGNGDHMKCH